MGKRDKFGIFKTGKLKEVFFSQNTRNQVI